MMGFFKMLARRTNAAVKIGSPAGSSGSNLTRIFRNSEGEVKPLLARCCAQPTPRHVRSWWKEKSER
jgi:hypothetical protein